MCGLVGFIDPGRRYCTDGRLVTDMAQAIRARGPDGAGAWVSAADGLALAHRRLSILDLSEQGRQPIQSQNQRWQLVYNGEIYNFRDIRHELEGAGLRFRGHSDTEVLVESLSLWGIERTLGKLNGMFAFAAFDRQNRKLFLGRDRLGIKPLYYGRVEGVFFFGSELKAFAHHPAWQPTICRDAVAAYLRGGYMPSCQSIWQGVKQVVPGTFVVVETSTLQTKTKSYWSVADSYEKGRTAPLALSDADAIAQLDSLLRDAVGQQMVADVPLGAFLSGGIDSSLVVALMQAQTQNPVKSFSIGFESAAHNEADYARDVAQHLGTDHTELYVTAEQALETIPYLSDWYDEPFADSSQIPTYLVSRLARDQVTVALSGDGGDEMFGGYSRYHLLSSSRHKIIPWSVIGRVLNHLPDPLLNGAGHLVPRQYRRDSFAQKLRNFVRNAAQGPRNSYLGTLTHWDPAAIMIDGHEPEHPAQDKELFESSPGLLSWMQQVDSVSYLPGDILTKVDRASMAVSLEARVPLLDHRVFEFACRLPIYMKIRQGQTKWLLRQVLYQYVPATLIDRPKMGFGAPLATWLRGPLKEWAWSRIEPGCLKKHGLLDVKEIQYRWDTHQSRKANWEYPLWTVIILHDWLEKQTDGANKNKDNLPD